MATKKKTNAKPEAAVEETKAPEAVPEEAAVEKTKAPETVPEEAAVEETAESEKGKIAPAQTSGPEKVKVKTELDGTPRFTRKQLLASKRYIDNRDALYAVLNDKATYTLAEVDEALSEFTKKVGGSKC